MNGTSPHKTAFFAFVVIMCGWGTGYTVFKSVEYIYPSPLTSIEYVEQDVSASIVPISLNDSSHKRAVIMLGGDVMFDRGIRAIGNRAGYDSLFATSLVDLFHRADIVAVNLEGPITDQSSVTLVNGKTTDSFTFTFPPVAADALKNAGITMVSLANNHTDNFGSDGYYSTQQYLKDAGVEWFGNPWNSTTTSLRMNTADDDTPVTTIVESGGIKIAFVGYHAFQSGVDRVVAEIRRVATPDVLTIVMPHWGEEYVSVPSEKIRAYARAFVAAGADAIIAAHPHIIAEQEWVGTVPVYYSIGNLLFDQYFSDEVNKGLIVELSIIERSGIVSLDHVTTHTTRIIPGVGVRLEK